MAVLKSTQLTNAAGTSGTPGALRTQDNYGRIRVASFDWSPAAAVASTDTVQLCVLPAGARIVGGRIVSQATLQSAAGVLMIGNSTTANKYLASTSSFSAATAAATFADTAVLSYLNNTQATNDAASQLSAQETVILSFQTAGCTASAGITVLGHILYVVD